jgi:glycolate oxidase FAD binding subunit
VTRAGTEVARQELGRACGDLRPAGDDDCVAGLEPSFVAAPATLEEAAATMRAAAALGLAVVPKGSGSRLSWALPPSRCDLVVSTSRLGKVIDHASGDLVAKVQAGARMEDLAAMLGQAGQQLALDAPAPAGAGAGTVGGVLATGMAGPKRLRYGTPRDLVIGLTVVRADGRVARSGGRVVKNVAGYDLGKLFAGSFGTLGLIAEATFRLHPLPAAAGYVTRECDIAGAAAAVAATLESSLQPSAVELEWPSRGAPLLVGVLIEGNESGVRQRLALTREVLGGDASVSGEPPGWWGRGAAAASDSTLIRIAFWAAALPVVLRALDRAAAEAGLDPPVSGSPAAGVLYASVDGLADARAVGRYVSALRAAVGGPPSAGFPPARGSVVVLNAPPLVRGAVDMWGPLPGAALMRAVKHQFDPDHRISPDRIGEGI